jgi:hypothetical protein
MKRFVFTLAAAALTACGSAENLTLAQQDSAAANAANTFSALADSVSHSDTVLANAYAALGESIRYGGRLSPITILLDGTPTEFLGTAQLTDFSAEVCVTASPCTLTARTFIAFRVSDPKQIVTLVSSADSDPIRAYLYPTFAPFQGPSASLLYIDAKGGRFFGSSGTQKASATTSSTACANSQVVIAIYPAPPKCTYADFTLAFDAKAEPSSFLTPNNTATGSHTLSMTSQHVLGVHLEVPWPARGPAPIPISPSAPMPATLSVRIDSVVNLTFTVTNPTSLPLTISFSSGQQFDFMIIDPSTGKSLWTWSADKLFIGAFTSQTIAPHGTLTYNAAWKPTKSGALVAQAVLTSVSHNAAAKVGLTVP